jgi:hypothetical protein
MDTCKARITPDSFSTPLVINKLEYLGVNPEDVEKDYHHPS